MVAKFWRNVAIGEDGDCWLWEGGRSSDGYGVFKIRQYFTTSAHRIAWALHNQKEPEAGHVCHACDVPLCCNPKHLWLGDAARNAADKVAKGRARGRFSHRSESRQNAIGGSK